MSEGLWYASEEVELRGWFDGSRNRATYWVGQGVGSGRMCVLSRECGWQRKCKMVTQRRKGRGKMGQWIDWRMGSRVTKGETTEGWGNQRVRWPMHKSCMMEILIVEIHWGTIRYLHSKEKWGQGCLQELWVFNTATRASQGIAIASV